MHLLGLDVGSSSIKAALVNAETGAITASATSPETELEMISLHPGWARRTPIPGGNILNWPFPN